MTARRRHLHAAAGRLARPHRPGFFYHYVDLAPAGLLEIEGQRKRLADPQRLARLNVSGGHIHNIALNAAFLAAEERAPVRMSHLLRAARTEYQKLERSLTATEVQGWM